MKSLKKIKPSFWDKPEQGGGHPHQPMDFQRKWKLIVVFTSLIALLPLIVVTIVEYRLTRRVMEEEMKNTMTGILEPAADSLIYALDRQTSVVDHLVIADKDRYMDLKEYIKEIRDEISAISKNIVGVSLTQERTNNKNDVETIYNCQSPEAGTSLLMERIDKRRYLVYEPAKGNTSSKLCVYLCYFPKESEVLKLKLDLDMQFLEQFLIPYHPGGSSGDIFVADHDGILVTPSLYFGAAGSKIPFKLDINETAPKVFETNVQNGEVLLTGYAHIPNSSLSLVMTKTKNRIKELWLTPRLKLLGYLIVSIVIILMSIMGMATYLVGRIHAADKKRMKALHHAGYSNKMASIGRLASGVAHEINNPLAIINEKTGLILDLIELEKHVLPNERLPELGKDVLKAVERCGMVTRRLLEFAKNMDPCKEPVDVEQTMRWVLTFFRREAKEHNIAVSVKTKGEAFPFNCDRGGLQQIFVNLLNNALAAMDRDGLLDIFIRYRESKAVEITVSDTGCGIPKGDIHNIFEPFFTVRENPSNTGLGLYVTYGIIKEMGGTIFVDSKLGKGTTFKVVLPVTNECLPQDDLTIENKDEKTTGIKHDR